MDNLRSEAEKLGFSSFGICRAEPVAEEDAQYYLQWVEKGCHAGMDYLAQNIDKRLNPALMTTFEAKSVIVMAMNYYFPEHESLLEHSTFKISRYAMGGNYHPVMRKKLEYFCGYFSTLTGGNIKAYVDTSPILEKYHAKKAGLGNMGKNTCLIIPSAGSWVFLAICITDVDLPTDQPFSRDLCGNCKTCISACPTGALTAAGQLDARLCISYLTIEHKTEFTAETPRWHDWIWGCDICQEVCPHNQNPGKSTIDEFRILPKITKLMNGQFNEDTFDKEFAGTSVKRGGVKRIPRNMKWVGK